MKDPTPWASILPLIAHPGVLGNVSSEALHLVNLRVRPFFIVNTGQDRLYPHQRVAPYIETLRAGGVTLDYRHEPEFGHDTNWWPRQRDNMEEFVAAHPRDPHPVRLEWATSSTGVGARVHWLVVRQLGSGTEESDLNDWNDHRGGAFFPRDGDPGQVRAERDGNTFRLQTSGVKKVAVLLSPQVIDFDAEIVIEANGASLFSGRVTPTVATLLHWYQEDMDRKMLFGAALLADLAARRVEVVPAGSW